ncbi:IS3 family transposase [Patescibacteria group bacterium]|nr:IS3 family transposase [Patescibacteria group bacterium]MBU2081793.1 IS3 family transposase [Patescibacteria group bacterium]MBU2250248.1 IS3 family transposase [Patescibacteria group bacterium]
MRANGWKKRSRVKFAKKFFKFLLIPKHAIVEFARAQVTAELFSISRICKLCGLSKNTYYNHKHPDERFMDKFENIKTKVKKIISKNSAYGVKRIKQALFDKFQIEIGRDALGRLLRLWSLGLKRKLRTLKKSVVKEILEAMADRVNLLIRTKIINPFQAITSDITEITYNHGKNKAYLAVHKDVLGQMVYGYAVGETMEAKLVISSFQQAVATIKKLIKKIPTDLLCHSDQGSQFTSYEYVEMVLKCNIVLSYSTPGTPTENPGQESFFGRLKDENRDEFKEMETFEELKKLISKKISYYNNERLHTSINLKSPKKFTSNFIKNLSK